MDTATLDLLSAAHSTVGGTFIGGIHTAANAGAYQTAVFGFGGLDVADGALVVDPRLPPAWASLEYTVVFRGQRAVVRATRAGTTVTAAPANTAPIGVHLGAAARPAPLAPGATATDTGR